MMLTTKRAYIEQRNNVKNGEVLELLMPDGELFPLTLEDMRNADGEVSTVYRMLNKNFLSSATGL